MLLGILLFNCFTVSVPLHLVDVLRVFRRELHISTTSLPLVLVYYWFQTRLKWYSEVLSVRLYRCHSTTPIGQYLGGGRVFISSGNCTPMAGLGEEYFAILALVHTPDDFSWTRLSETLITSASHWEPFWGRKK